MSGAFAVRGFGAILYKEMIHVSRDPITLILALALPVVQMLIFGYAINTRVQHISSAYLDEDRGAIAVRALDAFRASQQFDLRYAARSRAELERLIVAGRVRAAFDIPPNATADLRAGKTVRIQVLIDGSDSTVAQQAYAAATAVGAQLAREARGGSAPPLVEVRPRMLFNPSLRSANFLVPGLIGVIMQLITIFLMALSIVGERERGTLDQVLVTPIGAGGLILGKIVPYVAIGFVDFLLVLLAMRWVFGVTVAGNLGLLLLLGLGFMVAALGMGLWISSIAQTQVQAMLLTFAVTMPSILLSGFFFERELMPLVMQWVGYAIPLTFFLEILRGIILRGAGLDVLWPSVAGMLGLGAVLIVAATLRFARRSS
ncbi:ABC transporter permease [bacterium]|nr:MAG: ABC transporter permease [bacterium]